MGPAKRSYHRVMISESNVETTPTFPNDPTQFHNSHKN